MGGVKGDKKMMLTGKAGDRDLIQYLANDATKRFLCQYIIAYQVVTHLFPGLLDAGFASGPVWNGTVHR
jgi:hypothetical protein